MPSRSSAVATMCAMFDAGDSTGDIAGDLGLCEKYVRATLRAVGKDVPRQYRMTKRQCQERHSVAGYAVLSDPLDVFDAGAFIIAEQMRTGLRMGVFAPGLRVRCKRNGNVYVVRGALDSEQSLVSDANL